MSLSEEQIAEFKDVFSLFDKKGDHKIDMCQVGDILRALMLNPTQAEVKKVCGGSDTIEKRISFEEFLPMYQTVAKPKDVGSQDDFFEAFKVFDKEGMGFINAAELRHVLLTLGEKLSDEEVDLIMQGQEDSQGNVNYEEFIKHVMTEPAQ